MRIRLLTLIMSLVSASAVAQQDAQYSQYMFNGLVINPAYAGYKESLNINLLHRDQWTGLDGAPKTQSMVVDGAFGKDNRVGLGLSIVNDKIGLQRQSSAHANYAYRLPMGDRDARLSFGLSLGIAQYSLDGNKADLSEEGDVNFQDNQTYFVPDARFGIFFSNEKFYAGASATNILARTIDYQQVGQNTIARQGRHYFLTAGYLFDLGGGLDLKSSFLLKEDTRGPTSLDLNSFFLLKQTVWLGASYRTGVNLWKKNSLNTPAFKQNSVVGVVETFFLNKFRLGYAYDYSLTELGSYTNGTHEISLGLILNGNRRSSALLTPRYF